MTSLRSWSGVRVLVTGAGGFIGSHLTEELARRGARVRALAHYNSRGHRGFLEDLPPNLRRKVDVQLGDVTDPFLVDKLVSGQDFVFHLAALIGIPYSYAAPASYVSVNVQGTLNVLEACRRHAVRKLVQTSTSEVYGSALYVPIDETHPLRAQSPYAASKIAADQLALSFYRSFGLPVAIARPFNTFGPRQSARAVIPTLASQILSDRKRIDIGSLAPVRDFNYVLDTVGGMIAIAASSRSVGEVVNIGSGRGITISRTAEILMRLAGRQPALRIEKRRIRPPKSEVHRLLCGNAKARRLLGWRPRWSLEDGLRETLRFVKDHPHLYRTEGYQV